MKKRGGGGEIYVGVLASGSHQRDQPAANLAAWKQRLKQSVSYPIFACMSGCPFHEYRASARGRAPTPQNIMVNATEFLIFLHPLY
jgi:hypothetical protein